MRAVIWKIRTKFLLAFVAGIITTLTAAFFVSYFSINSVYMSINERSVNAELAQVANSLEQTIEETEKLFLTRIINSEAAGELSDYRRLTVPEQSRAVRTLSDEAMDIMKNFRSVSAVYVYVAEDYLLGLTRQNTRQYWGASEWPSERIMSLLQNGGLGLSVVGNIREGDFPLEIGEPSLMLIWKSGKSSYCGLLEEGILCEMYSGFMEDEARAVRILDGNGMIVSSLYKDEIGTRFAPLEGLNLKRRGAINENGMLTNYLPVKYGLVVTSSIPVSIYMRELVRIRNYLLFVFLLGMLLISAFFYVWIGKKLGPVGEIRLGMQRAGQGDYTCFLPVKGSDELSSLTENYNHMLASLQKLTDNRKQVEEELRKRELQQLRNEINPHFLYNTLNTIKCMADLDGNRRVAECVKALGGMIAPLYKDNRPVWPFVEELHLIAHYLEIMNMRCGDGIRYTECIPDELLEKNVMRFILQPIVENSITHGFAERGYEGRIFISAEEKDGCLHIFVEDDGKGMTGEQLEQFNSSLREGSREGGVGMLNVCRRISLRYGGNYGIRLMHSRYGGLCTEIRLPL